MALGSIKYPSDARRKLAQQSKKWVCEICGPISATIPEKKPKKSLDIEKEEKESNLSNEEKAGKVESEGKQISKKGSLKFKKKIGIDFDRRSLYSEVDGVIIEDINEYEEETIIPEKK